MDHSTGPEIICYVNTAGKERRVDPYVLELIAVILHSAQKKREHRAPRKRRVEIVSRGFDDEGKYTEALVSAGTMGSDELGVGSLLARFESAGVVFRAPQETK